MKKESYVFHAMTKSQDIAGLSAMTQFENKHYKYSNLRLLRINILEEY